MLFEAWKRVKASKGSRGVDGISIEDIEAIGIEKYLTRIKTELQDGVYKPSPVKTKIISMWDGTEGFDFLGLHHRRFSKTNKKGNRYGETYQYPSKKAMKKMKRIVKENINQRYLLVKTEEELIEILNPKIVGWRNYYRTRNDRKWMNAIDWYILCTFCRWNNKKHQHTRKLKGLYETKQRLREKGLQLMTA